MNLLTSICNTLYRYLIEMKSFSLECLARNRDVWKVQIAPGTSLHGSSDLPSLQSPHTHHQQPFCTEHSKFTAKSDSKSHTYNLYTESTSVMDHSYKCSCMFSVPVSHAREHLHEWDLFVEPQSNNINVHRGEKQPRQFNKPTDLTVTTKSWPAVKKGSTLFYFPQIWRGHRKRIYSFRFWGDGFFISQVLHLFLTDLSICNCNCEALNKLQ